MDLRETLLRELRVRGVPVGTPALVLAAGVNGPAGRSPVWHALRGLERAGKVRRVGVIGRAQRWALARETDAAGRAA